MEKTIWKFELEVTDVQQVLMPVGAEILCLQTQYEIPCIWAKVNPANEKESREFFIVGTGHEIKQGSDRLNYIDTFQVQSGSLVFHVFENLGK